MTSKPGRAGGKRLALATTGPIVAAVLLLAGLIFPLVIRNETATQIGRASCRERVFGYV